MVSYSLEHLHRLRPADDVATDHDHIGLDPVELGQHRREGRQIAVDVVERCDPHGGNDRPCIEGDCPLLCIRRQPGELLGLEQARPGQ